MLGQSSWAYTESCRFFYLGSS